MPRGNSLPSQMMLMRAMILGDPKAGKSDWAMRAALAGFNVLYLDGDVASQTLGVFAKEFPEAASRIYYFDIADRVLDGVYQPRMIEFVADFFAQSKILWNDTKQAVYSRTKDSIEDSEIWELRPSRLDQNWVLVCDSWTTLSQSAMAAKAIDLNIELADIEKVDRKIYSGVGNRLTQIATVISKMQCHVIVIGHPGEYAKKRAPDGVTVRNIKEDDMITEWTRMIPKSSSNPHGLTLGKNFSDIGWIDISRTGKRELSFQISNSRVSGGHLDGKGDPRADYSFANLLKSIGGVIPGATQPLGLALTIHEKGTYAPPAQKVLQSGTTKTSSSVVEPLKVAPKGLAGLAALKKPTGG